VTALVELRDVGVTYAGPPPVCALAGVDLAISEGEFVTIVGPSGSGKSTLLNILGMLDRPSSGSYLLDGVDTGTLSEAARSGFRARGIGFVFQAYHLLGYRTAVENVVLALLYCGVPRRGRLPLAQQALDRVGLADRADALPIHLSGGEKQRVAIARALAMQPRLLLCDEPTGNLDSTTATVVLSLIEDLHEDGLTVVMITHDTAVAALGQRTLMLRDGVVSGSDAS
jgi:putative ABC transport system ATP-binding protein